MKLTCGKVVNWDTNWASTDGKRCHVYSGEKVVAILERQSGRWYVDYSDDDRIDLGWAGDTLAEAKRNLREQVRAPQDPRAEAYAALAAVL